MDVIELSAPLAPPTDVIETSFYGQLVAALGKLSGGMLADGLKLDVLNDSLSLMSMQAIVVEGGLDLLVMGISESIDAGSAYLAMSDGSIWKFDAVIESGSLRTVIKRADKEDVTKNCSSAVEFSTGLRDAAIRAIAALQENEGQKFSLVGSVETDVHASICGRLKGLGRMILRREDGSTLNAYEFSLDAPPRVDLDTAAKLTGVRRLTDDEIEAEDEQYKKLLGVENPFPVKMGQA